MLTRRGLMATATAGAVFTTLHDIRAATPAGVVVMGKNIADMTSLDPHEAFESSGTEILVSTYQRLMGPAPDGSTAIAGDLAERWEIAPDGVTYTFWLKKDAKFASGNPVTAEDVVFSLQRLVTMGKTGSVIVTQFGLVKDNVASLIKAVDTHTLTITLPERFAPTFLLYCLGTGVVSVVEKAAALANQKDGDLGNAWLKLNTAGSGPLMLRAWRASESVTLDLNPHYNGPKPDWRRLVIRHLGEPSAQLLAIQQGDIDIARDLGPDQIRTLAGNQDINVVKSNRAAVMYITMNQNHPILSKPQVLQAIKWAVDYEALETNIVAGTYKIQQSFLPQDFPAAIPDRPFKKDVAKARALLAEAGYPHGFEIKLDHYSTGLYPDIVQVIQANLAEIDIKATLLSGEPRAVITKSRERRHEMAILQWGADYFDPNTNAQAFCENIDNTDATPLKTLAWHSSWQDKEISDMARAAARERDADKRIEMYAQLQRLHHQRAPFAFMLQQIWITATRRNISNFASGPISSRTFYRTIAKA